MSSERKKNLPAWSETSAVLGNSATFLIFLFLQYDKKHIVLLTGIFP